MRYRLGKWAPDMRLHAAAGRDAVRALGTARGSHRLRVWADLDELDREPETLERWLSEHKLSGIAGFLRMRDHAPSRLFAGIGVLLGAGFGQEGRRGRPDPFRGQTAQHKTAV